MSRRQWQCRRPSWWQHNTTGLYVRYHIHIRGHSISATCTIHNARSCQQHTLKQQFGHVTCIIINELKLNGKQQLADQKNSGNLTLFVFRIVRVQTKANKEVPSRITVNLLWKRISLVCFFDEDKQTKMNCLEKWAYRYGFSIWHSNFLRWWSMVESMAKVSSMLGQRLRFLCFRTTVWDCNLQWNERNVIL